MRYLLLLVLILPACATDLTRVYELSVNDLARAIEINKVAGDLEGQRCGEGLMEIVLDHATRPEIPPPIGLASTVAYVRAKRLGVAGEGDLLRRINLSCSAMFVEGTYTYTRLLLRLGMFP